MAWTAKITKIDTFYGAVNLTVSITQDSPPVTYTTQIGYNNAAELDRTKIIAWIKAEIARVSALHAGAQAMASDINVVITP